MLLARVTAPHLHTHFTFTHETKTDRNGGLWLYSEFGVELVAVLTVTNQLLELPTANIDLGTHSDRHVKEPTSSSVVFSRRM